MSDSTVPQPQGKPSVRSTNPAAQVNAVPDMIQAANRCRERGYGIVWIPSGAKNPISKGWTLQSADPEAYRPGENLGVQTGKISGDLICVDLDSEVAVNLAETYLPNTPMKDHRPGSPRLHLWYVVKNVPDNLRSACNTAQLLGGGAKTKHYRDPAKIDILGTGAQAVIPPSLHTSGVRREWSSGEMGHPAEVDCAELYAAVEALARGCGWSPRAVPLGSPDVAMRPRTNDVTRRASAYLRTMPAAISGQGGHSATMSAARAMVWGFDLGEEAGLAILRDEYNPRCEPPWTEDELRHKARDAATTPSTKSRGWLVHDEGLLPLSDTGNASRLLARYHAELRFVAHWKKWLVWDRRRWRLDQAECAVQARAKATFLAIFESAKQQIDNLKTGG